MKNPSSTNAKSWSCLCRLHPALLNVDRRHALPFKRWQSREKGGSAFFACFIFANIFITFCSDCSYSSSSFTWKEQRENVKACWIEIYLVFNVDHLWDWSLITFEHFALPYEPLLCPTFNTLRYFQVGHRVLVESAGLICFQIWRFFLNCCPHQQMLMYFLQCGSWHLKSLLLQKPIRLFTIDTFQIWVKTLASGGQACTL